MVCRCELERTAPKNGSNLRGSFCLFSFSRLWKIHWHFITDSFGQTFVCEINVGELFELNFHFFRSKTFVGISKSFDQQPPAVRGRVLGEAVGFETGGSNLGVKTHLLCDSMGFFGSPGIDQPNLRTKMVSKWSKRIWLKIFLLVPQMAGWFYNLWPNLVQKLS